MSVEIYDIHVYIFVRKFHGNHRFTTPQQELAQTQEGKE